MPAFSVKSTRRQQYIFIVNHYVSFMKPPAEAGQALSGFNVFISSIPARKIKVVRYDNEKIRFMEISDFGLRNSDCGLMNLESVVWLFYLMP